jgi:uncharacterized protein (DUF433 family)
MSDEEPIIRDWCGIPAVRGSRLTVLHIMDHTEAGRSTEWIAEFYRIPTADAQAAVDYIRQHHEELLPRYLKALERNRRGNPPHINAILAKSHEKLMRLKAEIDRRREEAGNARVAR